MNAQEAFDFLVSKNIPPLVAWRALKRYYPKLPRPKAEPASGGQQDGSWGGSLAVAKRYASIATGLGLAVSSTKRETKHTASGGVSDHWVGSKNAYAFDLSGTVERMDRAAHALMSALGEPWDGRSAIVKNFYVGGYRIQVLYRTNVGGNHFNHIHIGVRKS
jgi:hypothetical protein